ncbi:MAG TPA: hypothetical protein VGK04_11580 [Thermoanaerobaculia bacterium]
MARLRASCMADGEYDACTRFVAYRLETTCVARGNSSSIQARATFRPWILLHNPEQLSHELLHIDDVRRLVEIYVAEVEQPAFDSSAQCQSEALRAMSGFGDKMREFALRSNLERHPMLRRAQIRSHPHEILLPRR